MLILNQVSLTCVGKHCRTIFALWIALSTENIVLVSWLWPFLTVSLFLHWRDWIQFGMALMMQCWFINRIKRFGWFKAVTYYVSPLSTRSRDKVWNDIDYFIMSLSNISCNSLANIQSFLINTARDFWKIIFFFKWWYGILSERQAL